MSDARVNFGGMAVYGLPTPRVVEIEYATAVYAIQLGRKQRALFAYGLPTPRVFEIEYATISDVVLPSRNQSPKFAFILPTSRVLGLETDYVTQSATLPTTDPYLRTVADGTARITSDEEFRVISL